MTSSRAERTVRTYAQSGGPDDPRPARTPSPDSTPPGQPWLARGRYVMRNGAFERAGDDPHTRDGYRERRP